MKSMLLVFCSVLCMFSATFAQTRQVTGKVTGTDNQAVASATIKVKGSNAAATTNADGTFSLKAPAGSFVLQVSSLGFAAKEVTVGASQATVNVSLTASTTDLSDFQFVQEIQLESNELLVDLASTTKNQENYGLFDNSNFKEYWVTSSNNLITSFDQSFLFDSIKLNSISGIQKFFTTKSLNINEGIEYTLDFNVRKELIGTSTDYIQAYISGSRQTTINGSPTTLQVTQSIVTLETQNALLQKENIKENIKAEQIDNAKLYFDVRGTDWHISDISLKASQETAFSPDEITFIQSVPRILPVETFVYRFEFYDINNPILTVSSVDIWFNVKRTYYTTNYSTLIKAHSAYEHYNGREPEWSIYAMDKTNMKFAPAYWRNAINIPLSSFNNKWVNCTMVRNSANFCCVYLNGVFNSRISVTGSTLTNNQPIALDGGNASYWDNDGIPKIAAVKVYDKNLTAEEVLQNYNALKSRFV